METLSYYANNTPDGIHRAYCWEYLHKVDYGKGRFRDLVLFAVVNQSDSSQLRLDRNAQPMMCVCVCNVTQQKSGKAKLNKLKRALITKNHNISNLESFKCLPSMETFCFHKDFKGEPYTIRVENKKVNGKTVSNVTHIYSYLADDLIDVRGIFDTKN